MAKRTIYTRVYSPSSAGQLTSGRSSTGRPLSEHDILTYFPKHADRENRIHTPFVSVSSRIVDTIQRAFQKLESGESPADIWVVFIEVLADGGQTPAKLHRAQDLAKWCLLRKGQNSSHLNKPSKFQHESVFEWSIPEDYILHRVSLRTLIDRELPFELPVHQVSSTKELRDIIISVGEFQGASPFDIGVSLGFFARAFGARAPLGWIAYQLYYDCVRTHIEWDSQMVDLDYGNGHSERVDFDFFCLLDHGVDTALLDWWLDTSDFARQYEEFDNWRNDREEDNIAWYLMDFGEAWTREKIEAEAVRIGL